MGIRSLITTGQLNVATFANIHTDYHYLGYQIHERDKDTDFCMLVVRKLLRTNSKNVKVSTYGYSIAIVVLCVCGIGLKKM